MKTLIAASLLLALAAPAHAATDASEDCKWTDNETACIKHFASQPAVWNCGPDTYVSADKGEISVSYASTGMRAKGARQFTLKWDLPSKVWLNGKECKYVTHTLSPSP